MFSTENVLYVMIPAKFVTEIGGDCMIRGFGMFSHELIIQTSSLAVSVPNLGCFSACSRRSENRCAHILVCTVPLILAS